MQEAEIRFERENIEGIVPVGTYLSDAARRLGVRFADPCIAGEQHGCVVTINNGAKLLSAPTEAERQYFEGTVQGERRLACHARIEKAGEIEVMTKETVKDEPKNGHDESSEQYRKEFADLPLEKKIAELVHLEVMTLGETFSFILNSPYKVVDKIMDVMAEFGLKKEEADRNSSKPKEHVVSDEKTAAATAEGESADPVSAPDVDDRKTD